MSGKRINKKARNPYLVSYLSFALICVISLGLAFLLISVNVFREERAARDQAKLELISENMQSQLSFMRKAEIGITADPVYYPKYFEEQKYRELELLGHFEQYLSRFSMVDEILLYYGDDRVFLGSGKISDFDVYFRNLKDADREELRQWLDMPFWEGFSFLKKDNLYIGLSMDFDGKREDSAVKLCFEIGEDTFAEYLELLGGINGGNFGMYFDGRCLYSNADEELMPEGNLLGEQNQPAGGKYLKGRSQSAEWNHLASKKLWASTKYRDGMEIWDDASGLCFVFIPDRSILLTRHFVILAVILALSVLIWLVLLVCLFAGRTYRPIKTFMDQCGKNIAYEGKCSFRGNLAGMGEAIEGLSIRHREAREQLDIEEKRLEEIVLRSFLKGEHTDLIGKYAKASQVRLNGMFFFVCSVFFEEKMLKGEFTDSVRAVFESRIRARAGEASVYVLSRKDPCDMSVICSVWEQEDRQKVLEIVKEAAREFCLDPLVECGGMYDNPGKLSASYFESLDRLNHAKREQDCDNSRLCGTELDSKCVLQFFVFLRAGEEEKAIEELRRFAGEFEDREISFLMQQYFFSEFLYRITNIAEECCVKVDTQLLSLLISADNIKEFEEAAELVTHRFCGELREQERESASGEAREIIHYIERHFADYDISIEGVARSLKVSTESVRSTIQRHTGKSYKEYVLSLRMDYSRKLLMEEKLSVEETGRKVGYANASYFIRLFKKQYGITPADYKLINEVA